MTDDRPDPDALLRRLESEKEPTRGRLKVFFGASPGVGKTFAMLEEARRLGRDGRQVLVGWVETHGRAETAALLEGLPRLPVRAIAHRGVELQEFDLDAALQAKPGANLGFFGFAVDGGRSHGSTLSSSLMLGITACAASWRNRSFSSSRRGLCADAMPMKGTPAARALRASSMESPT